MILPRSPVSHCTGIHSLTCHRHGTPKPTGTAQGDVSLGVLPNGTITSGVQQRKGLIPWRAQRLGMRGGRNTASSSTEAVGAFLVFKVFVIICFICFCRLQQSSASPASAALHAPAAPCRRSNSPPCNTYQQPPCFLRLPVAQAAALRTMSQQRSRRIHRELLSAGIAATGPTKVTLLLPLLPHKKGAWREHSSLCCCRSCRIKGAWKEHPLLC